MPNAVPNIVIESAKRSIFCYIGKYGLPSDKLEVYYARSFVPGLLESDEHRNRRTPIRDVWCSVSPWLYDNFEDMADGYSDMPQVALRFPEDGTKEINGGHIDGLSTPSNGISDCTAIHSFTVLVGVALTSQLREYDGNLVVYPGSHKRVNQFLNYQRNKFGCIGRGTNLEWSPREYYPPGAIDGIPATQVLLNAGDAVFCHYQLVHNVSPNLNDNIRVNLYWRISHKRHDVLRLWEGIEHKIGEGRGPAPTDEEWQNVSTLIEMFDTSPDCALETLRTAGGCLEQAIDQLLASLTTDTYVS